MGALRQDWTDNDTAQGPDFAAHAYRINKSAFVFVQQADPEVTDPLMTGPAIWYVLDGTGQVVDVRIRTS